MPWRWRSRVRWARMVEESGIGHQKEKMREIQTSLARFEHVQKLFESWKAVLVLVDCVQSAISNQSWGEEKHNPKAQAKEPSL